MSRFYNLFLILGITGMSASRLIFGHVLVNDLFHTVIHFVLICVLFWRVIRYP